MDLFLFSTDPECIRRHEGAGLAGLVVDLERRAKAERQAGFDTEVNANTIEDLRTTRRVTGMRILCRVNPVTPSSREEIEAAQEAGADEILLPMVRTVAEVERCLEWIAPGVGLGILVETVDALRCAAALGTLPLSRAYVGLNDLWIDRGGTGQLFDPLTDGTLARIRPAFSATPFGAAGLTVVDGGQPVPCLRLLGWMLALGVGFTFLRRSYLRDIRGRDPKVELARLRQVAER